MQNNTPDFTDVLIRLSSASQDDSLPPSRKSVISIIKDIHYLLFPKFFPKNDRKNTTEKELLDNLYERIVKEISLAFAFAGKCVDESANPESLAEEIIRTLPNIKETLMKDVEALYEGDPAATCTNEVMLTYPGFYAISIYRIAHEFYKRKIPYIARLMTEYSHEKTGIDIHAGATIGEYFFIDHGTGIVVGETTTIGSHVKIYQGVTLGAKSFELDADGNPVKGTKRHPDIGSNVVIYANATILGGNTKIGDGAVIGGNVWLTHSVAPGEIVYYNSGK